MDKALYRLATTGYYNFQKLRMEQMNQIRDVVRKLNENIPFDQVEEKKEEKSFSKDYNDSKLPALLVKMYNEGKIDKETEEFLQNCLDVVNGGKELAISIKCPECKKKFDTLEKFTGTKKLELQYKKLMEQTVENEEIYTEFLSKVRGLGPIHSANLLKAFGDCGGYPTISKLWAHSGYSVVDGKAPRREKGKNVNYSPQLRTTIWKISDSLMKQNKGLYRKMYDEYKSKQLAQEYTSGELAERYNGYKENDVQLSKGHAHNRALRKIVKLFLSHFWEASRELAGYSIERTYVEGVLEHEHIVHWREALEQEGTMEAKEERGESLFIN